MTAPYAYDLSPGTPGGTLAILLHGTGGSAQDLLPLARALLPDATLVAPTGDVDENGAARFFRRLGEGRYDMADLARATAKLSAFVEDRIAAARPARVVGLGYSNGANILASVIFARRALFDDAVLMHPLIGRDPDPGPVRTRVLITAGARDPICPPALTRQLESWFAAQRAEVRTHWHPGGHGLEHSEMTAAAEFLATPSMAKGDVPR